MRFITSLLATLSITSATYAADVIVVSPCENDATTALQNAIDKAASYNGKEVTIKLTPGYYHISRKKASKQVYHISNTASIEENPDPTKHIGLWFRNLRNVTFDGDGAVLVTHGEMTTFVIDECENITLSNFTLTSADPSVPEIEITKVNNNSIQFVVTPPSKFAIDSDGKFSWIGEGWQFPYKSPEKNLSAIAQVFYPETNVTNRCNSPLDGQKIARVVGENTIEIEYDQVPDVKVGEIYQMRHSIRNEACGFINRSKDISLSNIEFNFMGNFGIVGQFSENLTYNNIRCRPQLGSKRTNAGFADFVQMSGCKGKIRILNSIFEGAHDDPINIHGTHLKLIDTDGKDKIVVKFMHGQSYGFQPFYIGDEVEIVNRHTLNCVFPAKIKSVKSIDSYTYELMLDCKLPDFIEATTVDDFAVENITWTPEVEIRNNYFSRGPTRGILITTRKKSVIEDNLFYRMPMPSILVSDDARGWYESGPVKNLTIRRNLFIECGSPVIAVWPEIDNFDKPVHSNISIANNRFIIKSGKAVSTRAAENITITDNILEIPEDSIISVEELIDVDNTFNIVIEGNKTYNTRY